MLLDWNEGWTTQRPHVRVIWNFGINILNRDVELGYTQEDKLTVLWWVFRACDYTNGRLTYVVLRVGYLS